MHRFSSEKIRRTKKKKYVINKKITLLYLVVLFALAILLGTTFNSFADSYDFKNNYAYKWDISQNQNGTIYAYYCPNWNDGTLVLDSLDPNAKTISFHTALVKGLASTTEYNQHNVENYITESTYQNYINGEKNFHYTDEGTEWNVTPWSIVDTFNPNGYVIKHVVLNNTINMLSGESFFAGLENCEDIDVSKLKADNVYSMGHMFLYCLKVKSLTFSNLFDTSKTQYMGLMFYDCTELEDLDLGSSFSTANCVNMRYMFGACEALKDFDATGFDTTNCTDYQGLFSGCTALTHLYMPNLNTAVAYNVSWAFYKNTSLESITLGSGFNLNPITSAKALFSQCVSLKGLDLSNINIKVNEADSYAGFLSLCTSLDYIKLPTFVGTNPATVDIVLPQDGSLKYFKYLNGVNKGEYTNTYLPTKDANIDELKVEHGINVDGKWYFISDAKYTWDISKVSGSKKVMAYYFDDTNGGVLAFTSTGDDEEITAFTHALYSADELVKTYAANYAEVASSVLPSEYTNYLTENGYRFTNGTEYVVTPWSILEAYSPNYEIKKVAVLNKFKTNDASLLFGGLNNATYFDITKIDLTSCTSLNQMFIGCENVEELDVSSFATSQVADMYRLFYKCFKLDNLDLTNWDTTSFVNARAMFCDCNSLTSLDLSNFDTSSVNDMKYMFSNCNNLSELTLGDDFVTSQVTDFGYMFHGCKSLININLDNFDTSRANTLEYMFTYCSELKNLDLSNFEIKTGCVTTHLLTECNSLKSIDLPKSLDSNIHIVLPPVRNGVWKKARKNGSSYSITSEDEQSELLERTALSYNALYLDSLTFTYKNKKYDTKDAIYTWDISELGDKGIMAYYFNDDNYDGEVVIYSLDQSEKMIEFNDVFYRDYFTNPSGPVVSYKDGTASPINGTNYITDYLKKNGSYTGFNFTNVGESRIVTPWSILTNFSETEKVKKVVVANTTKLKSGALLFTGLGELVDVDVTNLDTTNVTDISRIFYNCTSLVSADLSSFNTESVTDMNRLFESCYSLEEVDLSSFNTSQVTNMDGMFRCCYSLEEVDISNFNTISTLTMNGMFYDDPNLEEVILPTTFGESATSLRFMFYNNKKLNTLTLPNDFAKSATDITSIFKDSGIEKLALNVDFGKVATSSSDLLTGCNSLKEIILPTNLNQTLDIDLPSASLGYGWFKANGDEVLKVEGEQSKLINKTLTYNKLVQAPTYLKAIDGKYYTKTNVLTLNETTNSFEVDDSIEVSNYSLLDSGATGDAKAYKYSDGTLILDGKILSGNNKNISNAIMNNDLKSTIVRIYNSDDGFKPTNLGSFTSGINNLQKVVFDDKFNSSSITTTAEMFAGNANLKEAIFPENFASNASSMDGMFSGAGLTSITLPVGFGRNSTSLNAMFSGCSSLVSITLGEGFTSNATSISGLFGSCSNLKTITLNEGFGNSLTSITTNVFDYSSNLDTIILNENICDKVQLPAFSGYAWFKSDGDDIDYSQRITNLVSTQESSSFDRLVKVKLFDISSEDFKEFTPNTLNSAYTYTGSNIEPNIESIYIKDAEDNEYNLNLNDGDYSLSYADNVEIGEATVTITGLGLYTGTRTLTFDIEEKLISDSSITVTNPNGDVEFNGSTVSITLYDEDFDKTLEEGVDYSYSVTEGTDLISKGAKKVTITGLGNYKETRELTFNITGKSINNSNIIVVSTLSDLIYKGETYTIDDIKSSLKLYDNGMLSDISNSDYTFDIKEGENAKDAGKFKVIFSGVNNYEGTKEYEIEIKPYAINSSDLSNLKLNDVEKIFYKDGVSLKDSDKLLFSFNDSSNRVYPKLDINSESLYFTYTSVLVCDNSGNPDFVPENLEYKNVKIIGLDFDDDMNESEGVKTSNYVFSDNSLKDGNYIIEDVCHIYDNVSPKVVSIAPDKNVYGQNKDITFEVMLSEKVDTEDFEDLYVTPHDTYISFNVGSSLYSSKVYLDSTFSDDDNNEWTKLIFKGVTPNITEKGEYQIKDLSLTLGANLIKDIFGNELSSSFDVNSYKDNFEGVNVNTLGFAINISSYDGANKINNKASINKGNFKFIIDFSSINLDSSKNYDDDDILSKFNLNIKNNDESNVLNNITKTLDDIYLDSLSYASVTKLDTNKYQLDINLDDMDSSNNSIIGKNDYLGYNIKVSIEKDLLESDENSNVKSECEVNFIRCTSSNLINIELQREGEDNKTLLYDKINKTLIDSSTNKEVRFQNGDKLIFRGDDDTKIDYTLNEVLNTTNKELVIDIDLLSDNVSYKNISVYKDGFAINPEDCKDVTLKLVKLKIEKDGNSSGGNVEPAGTFDIESSQKEIEVTVNNNYKVEVRENGTLKETITETKNYILNNLNKLYEDLLVKFTFISTSRPSGGGGGGGSSTPKTPEVKPEEKIEEEIEPSEVHTSYISGYDDRTFRPKNNMTRAEFAKVLAMINSDFNLSNKDSYIKSLSLYSDVSSDEWYSPYIGFMTQNGLMNGYDDGSFMPNGFITRAEVCKVLASVFELKDNGVRTVYPDVRTNFWYTEAIDKMIKAGNINGYLDGTFRPDDKIKRCEMISLLNRARGRKVVKTANEIPNSFIEEFAKKIIDVPTNQWYFCDVLEASLDHDENELHNHETVNEDIIK